MNSFAIEIRSLTKKFRKQTALDGLNLMVPSGSIFGLVGRNGAGKTTCMSIIAGLLKADTGTVNLLGMGSFDPDTFKGRITLLPQDALLPAHARVANLLRYYARLQGLSARDAAENTSQALEWVGLSDRAKNSIRSLSHGMLRRVTIAQAFLGNPDIVLLDEPTSGLDPEQVVQIRNMITNRRGKQTIIISSHVLSEIESACDHVAFIENGRTLRQNSMKNILNRRKIITYRLKSGPLPIKELESKIPDAEFGANEDQTELKVELNDESLSFDAVNAILIPVLLSAGAGIIEIRTGSNLEQEFLNQF